MKNVWEKPGFIKKALFFYEKKIVPQNNIDLSLETLNSEFNQFTQTTLSPQEFENTIISIIQAKDLSGILVKYKDYIIQSHTVKLINKHGTMSQFRYSDGVHEFLEEILCPKQVVHNHNDLTSIFKQLEDLNIGFSGTVSSESTRSL